jgi:hypothetical protein
MNDDELRSILENATTIAVVGASNDPAKPSNRIPKYLLSVGFVVVPINPTATEVLGQLSYPTLNDVPISIDIVDVFRPGDEVPDIARSAVAIGARTLWLQVGVTSSDGKRIAEEAGLAFVEDRCIGETTRKLGVHKA